MKLKVFPTLCFIVMIGGSMLAQSESKASLEFDLKVQKWIFEDKKMGLRMPIVIKNVSTSSLGVLLADGQPTSLTVELRIKGGKILPGSKPPSGAGAPLDYGYSGTIQKLGPKSSIEIAEWQWNHELKSAWLSGGRGSWPLLEAKSKYQLRATYEITDEHAALIGKNRKENVLPITIISEWIDVPGK